MDFKLEIAKLLSGQFTDLSLEEILSMIEIPPNPDMGDYAFPCFRLAKILRKAPAQIAEDAVKNIEKADFIDEIKNVTGYINFYINKSVFAAAVLSELLKAKESYGQSDIGKGKISLLIILHPILQSLFMWVI